MIRAATLLVVLLSVSSCSDTSLLGLGHRSSDWINEPTVPTTLLVVTTVPVVKDAAGLNWFNDDIVTDVTAEPDDLRAEIFRRSDGDLIIQSSRAEIARLLPEIKFPTTVPTSAEYVTSQIVFNGDGSLSDDPRVGFGIWSSEPYSRSRSVAQIVVLWVAADIDGATDVAENPGDATCARFSDRATTGCEIVQVRGRPVWTLDAGNGTTLVWFDGDFRYELFGRDFVPDTAMSQMLDSFKPIGKVGNSEG